MAKIRTKSATLKRRRKPDQQTFQLTPPAAGEKPYPSAEFYERGASLPKTFKRRASFICEFEWSWSPWNGRFERLFLHGGRTHWILWARGFDNGYSPLGDVPIVRCLRKGLGEREAAMMLLAASLDLERREEGIDRPHDIGQAGILDEDEINAVADVVWGKENQESVTA